MDYYQTMRNEYVHNAMYPQDPMRVDWIPKGPPTGTLNIKKKDKCAPSFVTKIEGNAVEESARVFFEGIVDAQPNPKYAWYFNDEPVIPGHKGWEEAEIHDSRKMSTLIIKYTREHHMGKYTLVATNQLGSAECNCDLIVRKKQFPPVFWKRLYNVYGDDNSRFVGEVEVGGWPVPDVYWYKVTEDGEEIEVTTKTHTENWNGNPNKYVPESRIEVRQLDQIRHVIIFHHASDADSGLYRVRAVNALGEAECEDYLNFDGCSTGEELYLPPGWKDKKRLNWKDEDQRKKQFVGVKEPELTPEDLEDMRKKCGGVPLSRITEYLASLPDYVPTDKFNNMDRNPFKPGVDEHDYRPNRKGGKVSYPSVFKKGDIKHYGYRSDISGRPLPIWINPNDPRAKDSSDLNWRPVHPDLYIPEIHDMGECPDPPPVWESEEDIKNLIAWLNTMGCNVTATEIKQDNKKAKQAVKKENSYLNQDQIKKTNENVKKSYEQSSEASTSKQQSKIDKFSYLVPKDSDQPETQALQSAKLKRVQERDARKMWEEKLNANNVGAQGNAADFTRQFMEEMYQQESSSVQQQSISVHELSQQYNQKQMDPPALPPKTKIMHSPSRSLFSPTESIESNGYGTATVKTVEFLPVKEKVKLIAAQQEELLKKEENESSSVIEKKSKGVRILPPSPVTVRKMSVDDELYNYDEVVKRSTPVTQMSERNLESQIHESQNMTSCETRRDYSSFDSAISKSVQSEYSVSSSHFEQSHKIESQKVSANWEADSLMSEKLIQQNILEKYAQDRELPKVLDQLICDNESVDSSGTFQTDSTMNQQFQQYVATSSMKTSSSSAALFQSSATSSKAYNSTAIQEQSNFHVETPAVEECRRSFEEAELEAMALDSETSKSFSKQSSVVETCSTQSFVMQDQGTHLNKSESYSRNLDVNHHSSRKPVKSSSFARKPESFSPVDSTSSVPNTPISPRRRLRINQSPKPPSEAEQQPRYRESPTAPFQPGFYRKPPEDPALSHVFQLNQRSSSRSRSAGNQNTISEAPGFRNSAASSKAYDGDYESDL